jgi:hypothetical protein
LPDNYWNDDRLKELEKAYNASMSRKEMVRYLFPEAKPRHIETALAKYKDRLKLREKITRNPTGTREFNQYWTPDKRQLLRRAWRSGLDLQTIHSNHFDDIPYERLRKNIRMLRDELDIEPRKMKHVQPEKLTSPIEKRDYDSILDDLKKGKSVEHVASKYYADPDAIKKIKTKEFGPTEKKIERPYELIPPHHVAFANKLRATNPTDIDPKVKAKDTGRAIIARELNKKFGDEEGHIPYTVNQVDHMIRSGIISTPGREDRPTTVSPKGTTNRIRRQSIISSYNRGDDIETIASNHGTTPSLVSRTLERIQRKKQMSTPKPNKNLKDIINQ